MIEEGVNSPIAGELEIESVATSISLIYNEGSNGFMKSFKRSISKVENESKLKEVKAQMIHLQRELNN